MNSTDSPQNLDVLLDIPVKITAELGGCDLPMRDVLLLKSGSVVSLNKAADAPVDLYVNQRLFARGEVVVVGDQFGIKITEILARQS